MMIPKVIVKLGALGLLAVLMLLIGLAILLGAACNTTWKMETGSPSLANRKAWKTWLKVRSAESSEPIGTTMTHISNVSHEIAVAKINQALQSYTGELPFKLSTVFELTESDKLEGEVQKDAEGNTVAKPAVSAVVVGGHMYYVGMLDYAKEGGTTNRGSYDQTGGIIPAIAVADGEDESKAAWVRTADDDGKPYQIKIHLTDQSNIGWDDNNIYRYLRNRGWSTYGCYSIDNPTLEPDDKWRLYYTVTYNYIDSCGFTMGSMEYPTQLLVVNAETGDIDALPLDNPKTSQEERDPRLDTQYAWVDQIYSPRLMKEWVTAWGYNPNNYGVTSHMDELVLDHQRFDEVMNIANTNITFVAYITSNLKDESLIGVMCIDPRTAHATFFNTQGPDGMATKTSAVNAIRQATVRDGFDVEDLTLHTIYNVHTWSGELTRPAYDNQGVRYGSLYAGTVLFKANYDHMPAHVVWARTKHQSFVEYQKNLVIRFTQRVGSNVLEIREITGKVSNIYTLVLEGNSVFIVELENYKEQWEIPIDYVGNPVNVNALRTQVGDTVYLKYADIINNPVHFVQEIQNISRQNQKEEAVNQETDQKVEAK